MYALRCTTTTILYASSDQRQSSVTVQKLQSPLAIERFGSSSKLSLGYNFGEEVSRI